MVLQGRQNDFQSGGTQSLRSEVISEFCISVLATASLSKLLEQGCPTRGPRAALWPAMLSRVARVEITVAEKP